MIEKNKVMHVYNDHITIYLSSAYPMESATIHQLMKINLVITTLGAIDK